MLAAILALGLPAGGLKYALDLRGERQRALAAQREAEDLMDFMLEDLYERLEPLGQVELRALPVDHVGAQRGGGAAGMDGAAARAACEEALAIVTPIAEATGVAYYVDTQVMALLSLGRVEEARPLVERLLADGWDDPELLELCREHGLLPQ